MDLRWARSTAEFTPKRQEGVRMPESLLNPLLQIRFNRNMLNHEFFRYVVLSTWSLAMVEWRQLEFSGDGSVITGAPHNALVTASDE